MMKQTNDDVTTVTARPLTYSALAGRSD